MNVFGFLKRHGLDGREETNVVFGGSSVGHVLFLAAGGVIPASSPAVQGGNAPFVAVAPILSYCCSSCERVSVEIHLLWLILGAGSGLISKPGDFCECLARGGRRARGGALLLAASVPISGGT